jgi:hypothetical protein
MGWHDKEMRAVYAETLIELMKQNRNIICLESDLGKATGTFPVVRDAFPDKFYDVGVAEANMVSALLPVWPMRGKFLLRRVSPVLPRAGCMTRLQFPQHTPIIRYRLSVLLRV